MGMFTLLRLSWAAKVGCTLLLVLLVLVLALLLQVCKFALLWIDPI
jgi:hypothetical protein